MRRTTGLIILCLLCFFNTYSQDKIVEARNSFMSKDLDKAKSLIDEAVNDAELSKNYQAWYWRGVIYKEIYKNNEKGSVYDSKNRETAIASFKKALDDQSKVQDDILKGTQKSLNFLASTLYNDAVVQLDTVNYRQAKVNFEQYKEVVLFLDPKKDVLIQSLKFDMKLATIYVSLYESHASEKIGEEYFEMARTQYANVIDQNNKHLMANYNLGILFYNKAVNIIQSMDYDIDLDELSKKEKICVELFLKALPYAKTAYDLNPVRKETLIQLKGIYYSLGDEEKYNKYKKELEELSN